MATLASLLGKATESTEWENYVLVLVMVKNQRSSDSVRCDLTVKVLLYTM
jgi:hypothetical protein